MRKSLLYLCGIAVAASLVLASPAVAGDRPANEILAEYDAVEMPTYDREKRGDKEYAAEYREKRQAAVAKRCELILELYQADPRHERLAELLPERWAALARPANSDLDKAAAFIAELDAAAKKHKGGEIAVEALHAKARAFTTMIRSEAVTRDQLVAAVDAFVKAAPKDKRAPRLMMTIAKRHTKDTGEQIKVYNRVAKLFPDDRSAKYAKGKARQIEELGKSFALEFNDAISGESVSMRRLRGKIVVVDFWATWCRPCVKEMPHMKELYAQYKDKGVEFIGVSLDVPEDEDGLKKLKEYCEENEIAWPQYYQGNKWESEYSTSWGINGIPTMFIIDSDGKLHSTRVRGKLDELIPELLAKRDT